MPTKNEVISIFNSRLLDFLRECAKVFSDDAVFSTYPMLAEVAITADPTGIIDVLNARVFSVFGDRIDARDEAFFLDNDEICEGEEPAVKMVIGMLRDKWKGLDAQGRESMWAWLLQLKKIATKAAAL